MSPAHFTPRRIIGYTVPLASFVIMELLVHPNSSDDARRLLWLFPAGCLIGSFALLVELVRKDLSASWPSVIVGLLTFIVGIIDAFYIRLFEEWYRGH